MNSLEWFPGNEMSTEAVNEMSLQEEIEAGIRSIGVDDPEPSLTAQIIPTAAGSAYVWQKDGMQGFELMPRIGGHR